MPKCLGPCALLLLIAATDASPDSPRLPDPTSVGSNPPNIIVVYTDDQRWDTLAYMPAVARLADEGVYFTNSFVTSPVCGPSRASFLTGRLASTLGITRNEGAAAQLDEGETIAVTLQEQGYVTGLFGKYINGYRDQFPRVPPGWSEWRVLLDSFRELFSPGSLYTDPIFSWSGTPRLEVGYSTDLLADYAVEFLEANAGSPFFLLLSFWAAHVPLHPADRHLGLLAGQAPEPPPSLGEQDMVDKPPWLAAGAGSADLTPIWNRILPGYLETLLSVDEAVARIRAKLEELELDENTIIVFTSDNGFMFGEHWWIGKGLAYEESIRVPLVFWGAMLEPRRVDELVLNIDVAPTLAELAGSQIASDGRSLVPLFSRRGRRWRRAIEIEWDQGFGLLDGYRAIRTRYSKYIAWDNGHREFYILPFDPYEMQSLLRLSSGSADSGLLDPAVGLPQE